MHDDHAWSALLFCNWFSAYLLLSQCPITRSCCIKSFAGVEAVLQRLVGVYACAMFVKCIKSLADPLCKGPALHCGPAHKSQLGCSVVAASW